MIFIASTARLWGGVSAPDSRVPSARDRERKKEKNMYGTMLSMSRDWPEPKPNRAPRVAAVSVSGPPVTAEPAPAQEGPNMRKARELVAQIRAVRQGAPATPEALGWAVLAELQRRRNQVGLADG
jgi:hypothetical protein